MRLVTGVFIRYLLLGLLLLANVGKMETISCTDIRGNATLSA